MKTAISIESRLTSRYVQGYAHLDNWERVCDARKSKSYMVAAPSDEEASDGGSTALLVVLTPAELDAAKNTYRRVAGNGRLSFTRWMNRAIEESLSGGGCGHEYDCCGCASYYADAHRTKPREFSVIVRLSYNY
ncbi:hypothetical protein [Pseudomonas serbica]|uniref:hypothetical protein n=1 Tax=Pseudomonas serbica TaxID=2965074 RepID=UPI00237BF33E|nr:hypothetical protein [Pseudomonas serbica]